MGIKPSVAILRKGIYDVFSNVVVDSGKNWVLFELVKVTLFFKI